MVQRRAVVKGRLVAAVVGAAASGLTLMNAPVAQANCSAWNTDEFFRKATAAYVSHCLEAGSSLEAENAVQQTPLHLAALHNESAEVVKALLDAGADIEARDEYGWTPIDYAAERSTGAAKVLLDAGASKALQTCSWNTKWYFLNVTIANISQCLEDGANIEARDEDGSTPLHHATSFSRSPDVVKALLNAGANTEARDEDGSTPLHHATSFSSRSPDVVKALLNAGANIEARDEDGLTPLHHAISDRKSLKFLDLLSRTKEYRGILDHTVSDRESLDVVKILLNAGANIEAEVELGRHTIFDLIRPEGYPLHLAAWKSKSPEVVKALLDAGANPSAQASDGSTPWDWIEDNDALKGTDVYWFLNQAQYEPLNTEQNQPLNEVAPRGVEQSGSSSQEQDEQDEAMNKFAFIVIAGAVGVVVLRKILWGR